MLPALTLLNGLPAISPSRGRAIPYERRPLIRPRSARPPSTGWGEEDAAARPAISSPQRGEGGEGESPSRVRGQERSQTSICDCPASRGEISRHLRLRQSPAVQSLQELRKWVFFAPPSGLPDPALRYGSGRSSFEKPNRWLFVAFGDHSSPPARGEIEPSLRPSPVDNVAGDAARLLQG